MCLLIKRRARSQKKSAGQQQFFMKNYKRGSYNEIIFSSLPDHLKKQIRNLFNKASKSDKIDEHGNWEFGAEFDKKSRGYAINWDLYAFGRDTHNSRLLAIIQIRKFERRRKNYYPNIKKSYFLIGRNEDDTAFAHSVESRVVHYAIKNKANPVKHVQNWIFGCDYSNVIRQGDIALIPCKRKPSLTSSILETEITLQGSHFLKASLICNNGNLYALDPCLTHLPGTHPRVFVAGWYKVITGKRASFYDFAAPTID